MLVIEQTECLLLEIEGWSARGDRLSAIKKKSYKGGNTMKLAISLALSVGVGLGCGPAFAQSTVTIPNITPSQNTPVLPNMRRIVTRPSGASCSRRNSAKAALATILNPWRG